MKILLVFSASGGFYSSSRRRQVSIGLRGANRLLDVGCFPGGWSQVAVELVGPEGHVIGVDLEPCQPVEGAVLLTGDITDPYTQERVLEELGGDLINVIVSDISPDITGKLALMECFKVLYI